VRSPDFVVGLGRSVRRSLSLQVSYWLEHSSYCSGFAYGVLITMYGCRFVYNDGQSSDDCRCVVVRRPTAFYTQYVNKVNALHAAMECADSPRWA
jgi:hypothetical protein